MINKILFTALLIAAVVLWLRFRNSKDAAKSPNGSARTLPAPGSGPTATAQNSRQPLFIAIALALGLLLISASWVYLSWQADHVIVQIRVVNTRSGEISLYRAYQAEVHGRRFTTLDGQNISVSDVERIETAVIQD